MDIKNIVENLTFPDAKALLTGPEYNFVIKESGNLYLVFDDVQNGAEDEPNGAEAEPNDTVTSRGIILEKDTNKVVCNIPEDTLVYPDDMPLDSVLELSSEQICSVERAVDGSLIRLYFYDGSWRIATSKCINAYESRWYTQKSFGEMFMEATYLDDDFNDPNFLRSGLSNKEYTHFFVVCHPDNKIVTPHTHEQAYYIGSRHNETFEFVTLDSQTEIQTPIKVTDYTMQGLIDSLPNMSHESPGYIIRTTDNIKIRLFGEKYREARDLKGNTPSMYYRFSELKRDVYSLQAELNRSRRDNEDLRKRLEEKTTILNKFVEYFPEHNYTNLTNEVCGFIHKLYMACYIRHVILDHDAVPKCFFTVMSCLHQQHINTGRPTFVGTVKKFIKGTCYVSTLATLLKEYSNNYNYLTYLIALQRED